MKVCGVRAGVGKEQARRGYCRKGAALLPTPTGTAPSRVLALVGWCRWPTGHLDVPR